MPYVNDTAGIYVIRNRVSGGVYVGQSRHLKKRLQEHRRLLRRGVHFNSHLQRSFAKYGEDAFEFVVEVVVEDPNDLDEIEDAFISEDATFEPCAHLYNTSKHAAAPMTGRHHTEDARLKIKDSLAANPYRSSPEYRNSLKKAQERRLLEDPDRRARIKFIVENPHMTYADRARHVQTDTSTCRKMYLRWRHLEGVL